VRDSCFLHVGTTVFVTAPARGVCATCAQCDSSVAVPNHVGSLRTMHHMNLGILAMLHAFCSVWYCTVLYCTVLLCPVSCTCSYIGQFSRDGRFFAAAYQDQRVRLYDVEKGWKLRQVVEVVRQGQQGHVQD
jgi:hypothetical protein